MSLSKKLVCLSNTCEDLKVVNNWDHSITEIAEVIKYALDERELKELIKELKK